MVSFHNDFYSDWEELPYNKEFLVGWFVWFGCTISVQANCVLGTSLKTVD